MYHSLIIQCTGTGHRLLPLIGIIARKKVTLLVTYYTGLARKWNREVLRGLESTPQRGSAELSGGSATSSGGSTLLTPIKYCPGYGQ